MFLSHFFFQKIVSGVVDANHLEDVLPFICRFSREFAQSVSEGKEDYIKRQQSFYVVIFLAAALLPSHWMQGTSPTNFWADSCQRKRGYSIN